MLVIVLSTQNVKGNKRKQGSFPGQAGISVKEDKQ